MMFTHLCLCLQFFVCVYDSLLFVCVNLHLFVCCLFVFTLLCLLFVCYTTGRIVRGFRIGLDKLCQHNFENNRYSQEYENNGGIIGTAFA